MVLDHDKLKHMHENYDIWSTKIVQKLIPLYKEKKLLGLRFGFACKKMPYWPNLTVLTQSLWPRLFGQWRASGAWLLWTRLTVASGGRACPDHRGRPHPLPAGVSGLFRDTAAMTGPSFQTSSQVSPSSMTKIKNLENSANANIFPKWAECFQLLSMTKQ